MSVSADLTMEQPQGHACTACQTVFEDPEKQRKHYKTDWHRFVLWGLKMRIFKAALLLLISHFRYNLKRKAAEMPPLPLEAFLAKMSTHEEQMKVCGLVGCTLFRLQFYCC